MSTVVETLTELANQYGYPGVFIISVLGSAVPFLPFPYLAVVLILSTTQNPLWLGIFAGIGGASGKVTSYLLGRGGYVLTSEETRKSLDALHGVIAKYGTLGVFLFSVTPLPDDTYIIPMGIARLPFWRFFIANLTGKIVLSVFVAYLGRTYFSVLSIFLGGESLLATISVILVTVVLSLVLLRADWILAIKIVHTKGLLPLILELPAILRLTRHQKK